MDDDILSQGDDGREPSRWPRRLGVIAAVVAAAVGGIVYLTQPHGRPGASAAHPASAIPPAPVKESPGPVPSPEFTRLPDEPDGIVGRTVPWAGDLRLPLAAARPAWFSPATGRTEQIGGLPADNAGYQFTRVGGGWAVQAGAVQTNGARANSVQADESGTVSSVDAVCGSCAGPALPVWFLADGARSATRVGTANLVAPAASPGALWLTSYPPTADPGAAAGMAREVSATGAQLGRPVRLPAGYVIDQATSRGLLLARTDQQPGTAVFRLWEPAARAFGRTFDQVIAASATEVAWTSRCAPTTCQVQVVNLATGRRTAIGLPAGDSAAGAAFSPSGALLALQLSYGLDGALAMRLDVASVATGRLTQLPGTSVSSDALFGFGWPAADDSLVAEFNFMPVLQLASWHPGSGRLAVSDLKPGRTEASLIVG